MRLPHGIGRNRHDPVCQEVVEMVTDYLENSLDRGDKQRFERHLQGCDHCNEYLAQVRETITLVGRLTPEDLSPPMRDAFTDVYRRWRSEG